VPRDDRAESDGSRSIPVLRSVAIAALDCIARIHQKIDEGLRLR
jgi:hypothetical protein